MSTVKPTVSVHKFSSCDGCQLAFLNMGEALLTLSELVEIKHFAEAGALGENEPVNIAFIEGSVSTPDEVERIQSIRKNCDHLVAIGACATSGGLQALRNIDDSESEWRQAIYAKPETIQALPQATAINQHVKVDLELWGCPINTRQVVAAVRALLLGVLPVEEKDKLCLECKRQGLVCVMVTSNKPCMGPVTRTGCGALCPQFGRDCYACYGPAENCNTRSLGNRIRGMGYSPEAIANRFHLITSAATPFKQSGKHWRDNGGSDD